MGQERLEPPRPIDRRALARVERGEPLGVGGQAPLCSPDRAAREILQEQGVVRERARFGQQRAHPRDERCVALGAIGARFGMERVHGRPQEARVEQGRAVDAGVEQIRLRCELRVGHALAHQPQDVRAERVALGTEIADESRLGPVRQVEQRRARSSQTLRQLHRHDDLARAGRAEDRDRATLGERAEEVDGLDPRLAQAGARLAQGVHDGAEASARCHGDRVRAAGCGPVHDAQADPRRRVVRQDVTHTPFVASPRRGRRDARARTSAGGTATPGRPAARSIGSTPRRIARS